MASYIPEGISIEDWHDTPRTIRRAVTRDHERRTSITQDRGHEGCDECDFAKPKPLIEGYHDLPMRLPPGLRK
jgi:hypothetical protein